VPLIAALLGIPAAERYPLLELSPPRQQQLTLEVLIDQLAGLSAEQTVLLTYEDAHWLDPTTQELLGLTIERMQQLPVLLLVTMRPEFQPSWSGQPHVSMLALTRLSRREGAAMVERLVYDKALPDEVAAQIVAKTDGVPLFVEELTKTVLESGLLQDAGDRWELSGPLPPLAIPATLHDSLLARLDRLAPVKEIAQIGAALGREFSHALLAAVAERPEPELQAALDQLVAAELVYRRGAAPDVTYSFKHALVQDAAYGTLLKSRRQQLHARIAKVLEQRFPETTATQPEILAHHSSEAGMIEKAAEYWGKAGQLAAQRSAMVEAATYARSGLALLSGRPPGPERSLIELDLQLTLGDALTAWKGVAAPEAGEAYARARGLCRAVDCGDREPRALWSSWIYQQNQADLAGADDVAQELLQWASARRDATTEAWGHRCAGSSKFFTGEFAVAFEHFQQILALHAVTPRDGDHVLANPPLTAMSMMPWVLLLQGYPDRALKHSREAIKMAEEHGRPYPLAVVLHQQNVLDVLRGDRRTVEERTALLMALTAEHGFSHWHATATILHGWAIADNCALEPGLEEMRCGLVAKKATGARLKVPFYLGLMADLHQRAGRATETLHLLHAALAQVEETGECWFESELHRLKGEALLVLSPDRAGKAEVLYQQALAVAQNQSARVWELRAATSLARLWRDQGRRAKARDLLTPVYGWFTEGFETADLKDAKALLEELQ
jgi:predicted ATPase